MVSLKGIVQSATFNPLVRPVQGEHCQDAHSILNVNAEHWIGKHQFETRRHIKSSFKFENVGHPRNKGIGVHCSNTNSKFCDHFPHSLLIFGLDMQRNVFFSRFTFH